jgi:hypothetical protein
MYAVGDHGVHKTIQSWSVVIPMHDNAGTPFPSSLIDEVLEEISTAFTGFTIVNCIGHWKHGQRSYNDQNLQLIIDTIMPEADTQAFFVALKRKLEALLSQQKIYITLQASKQELLTFEEFFSEAGLEHGSSREWVDQRRLAEKIVKTWDFALQRLQYETTVLTRDVARNKIVWERRLCGILLRSEWDDNLPRDIRIIAADQVDKISHALVNEEAGVLLIGHYEYQGFILDKHDYRPIVRAEADHLDPKDGFRFVSQLGESISCSRFIQDFTGSVVCNYAALREEGFTQEEITISIGRDGSLQEGNKGMCRVICYVPARIPYEAVIQEVFKNVEEGVELYDTSDLDPVAFLQAKAKNRHIFTRAQIRNAVRDKGPS